MKQIEIIKKYIGLFVGQGDKKLCTPYGLKHKVEKYTDYFTKEHVYISEESAIIALEEIGIEIDKEGYVVGAWEYPSFELIVEALGNSDFEKYFTQNDYQVPFYRIPHLRVSAMIEAYSSAYERTGKDDFPLFERYQYEQLKWIEFEGGALAYSKNENEIVFDAIYVKTKRSGVGSKLFKMFLDEVSNYQDDCIIEIDAYTDDSKEFFKAMMKQCDFFKPSKRLTKPSAYSIEIADLKKEASVKGEKIQSKFAEGDEFHVPKYRGRGAFDIETDTVRSIKLAGGDIIYNNRFEEGVCFEKKALALLSIRDRVVDEAQRESEFWAKKCKELDVLCEIEQAGVNND